MKKINEAKQRFTHDQSERKIDFLRWLVEAHSTQDVCVTLPQDAETMPARRLARWVKIDIVCKFAFPDRYHNDDESVTHGKNSSTDINIVEVQI